MYIYIHPSVSHHCWPPAMDPFHLLYMETMDLLVLQYLISDTIKSVKLKYSTNKYSSSRIQSSAECSHFIAKFNKKIFYKTTCIKIGIKSNKMNRCAVYVNHMGGLYHAITYNTKI